MTKVTSSAHSVHWGKISRIDNAVRAFMADGLPFIMKRSRAIVAIAFAALLLGLALANGATITVNSSADSGGICPGPTCTLRQAIATALPGDTIDFSPSISLIDLTSGELLIDKDLIIAGPGPNLLTVQWNSDGASSHQFRIFHIASSNNDVTISGLTIAKGRGLEGPRGGGAILIDSGNTVTLSNSTLSGNSAGGGFRTSETRFSGGAIANTGTLTINNSTISGNVATKFWDGGGIYNEGAMTINNSTISGNSSSFNGGGGISNGGTMTINNSTVSGNKVFDAAAGGGVLNVGAVTIINSTITNNGTDSRGGFTPSQGDGIYNHTSATLNVRNTIIAANFELVGRGGEDVFGPLNSQGYNLIGTNKGAVITPAQPTDQIGTATSPIDPVLGPLQDNGGPTFTHALLSGSRAIDKGHSSGWTTDQRGFPRPVDNPAIANATGGDGSDIGAFEKQEALIARSSNLSTRARVQAGDNVMIGGFIITGNVPKPVVLRGLGPSLVNSGVPAGSVLNDPVLELRGAQGALLTSNDNWKESPQRGDIEGTVFEPTDDREAVIRTTLPPERYTAVLKGKDGGIGVGVVEIYDLDQSSDSTLANISSRAFVEAGNNVLIGGFILGGSNGSPTIVIRAIGPSLANFGFANPLPDPTLELRDANAMLLVSNDDWQDDAAQASYIAAVRLQPQHDFESAIAATLPPGAYTAIVAGKNGETGVALVEIYNLQ
jgi:hypothetical protein